MQHTFAFCRKREFSVDMENYQLLKQRPGSVQQLEIHK